jgi:hypothetical protein
VSAIVWSHRAAKLENAQSNDTAVSSHRRSGQTGVVLIKARDIKPLVDLPAVEAIQAGEGLVGSESHDFC